MLKFIPNALNSIKVGWQVTIVTAISLLALTALAYGSYYEAENLADVNHESNHIGYKGRQGIFEFLTILIAILKSASRST